MVIGVVEDCELVASNLGLLLRPVRLEGNRLLILHSLQSKRSESVLVAPERIPRMKGCRQGMHAVMTERFWATCTHMIVRQ